MNLGRLGGDAAKAALQGILASKREDGAIRAIASFKSLRRMERRAANRVLLSVDRQKGEL